MNINQSNQYNFFDGLIDQPGFEKKNIAFIQRARNPDPWLALGFSSLLMPCPSTGPKMFWSSPNVLKDHSDMVKVLFVKTKPSQNQKGLFIMFQYYEKTIRKTMQIDNSTLLIK